MEVENLALRLFHNKRDRFEEIWTICFAPENLEVSRKKTDPFKWSVRYLLRRP